jgi:hypothetical protein
MLRALLDFAETGKLAPGSSIGGFDSPFEGCYPGAIRFGATASKSVRRSPETGLPSFVMRAGWILRVSSRLHYVSGRTRAWLKMQVPSERSRPCRVDLQLAHPMISLRDLSNRRSRM